MTGLRLLHVDDDPDFLALSRTVLNDLEGIADVETATDVAGALDRVSTGEIDCLISDSLRTPAGDPFVVTARRTAPELPIVVFTGQDWSATASNAAAADAVGFVRKGVGCFDRLQGILDGVDDDWPTAEAVTLARHDWDGPDELAVTLAGALATVQDTSPETVGPLGEWVDVEALDRLCSSATVDVAVSVAVGSTAILVDADGRIGIEPN